MIVWTLICLAWIAIYALFTVVMTTATVRGRPCGGVNHCHCHSLPRPDT